MSYDDTSSIVLLNLGQILQVNLSLTLAINTNDLEEYIMKQKRVEYLAISDKLFGNDKNLFSLKDEVKEFELYDIKV
ncbi:hypothetical protein C1645_832069 [Glomus cerebriforme]|uniref:Uncharacterized protein n=1 Tax=Glomus cerebriforme TaxID=658196 RepID=A0A397SKE3_9GLOM|nr:hypothetical protein C1645_832069 [Glomus cerebriforme]